MPRTTIAALEERIALLEKDLQALHRNSTSNATGIMAAAEVVFEDLGAAVGETRLAVTTVSRQAGSAMAKMYGLIKLLEERIAKLEEDRS